MKNSYILTLSCPDRSGIVAKVTNFIAEHKGWILEASQHGDIVTNWFYMRVEVKQENFIKPSEFKEKFKAIADELSLNWQLRDTKQKQKVVILASKSDHCLTDILHRYRNDELNIEILSVISNHEELKDYVEWHDIPYHHIPVTKENKKDAFSEIDKIISKADVTVLARYMQIIPPELCTKYQGKIINIHHSFLPAFAGANPYQQAYDLGVKLIGATCHYVTAELDQGPIIEQDVIRVHHGNSVDDLMRLGKDVERQVLAKGLRLHLEERVLVHDNKTIVFD